MGTPSPKLGCVLNDAEPITSRILKVDVIPKLRIAWVVGQVIDHDHAPAERLLDTIKVLADITGVVSVIHADHQSSISCVVGDRPSPVVSPWQLKTVAAPNIKGVGGSPISLPSIRVKRRE